MPPHTGRIYDRTRSVGNTVSDRSLDIREESIYGLLVTVTLTTSRMNVLAIPRRP